MTEAEDLDRMERLQREVVRRFKIPYTDACFTAMHLDFLLDSPTVESVPWDKVGLA